MPKLDRLNSKGIINSLFQRELSLSRSPYRITLKVVKAIVCSEENIFKKVWEIQSKKPIAFIDHKIFLNNFNTCYTACGKNALPTFIYHLESGNFGKIESTLIYSRPVYDACFSNPASYKRFLLALTSLNWLCSYDNETGKLLQTVYLGKPSRYKFRYIDWDRHGETITIMSIKNPLGENAQASSQVLITIVWFSIFPLEFLSLMEFDRKIFGKECVHCNVSEGLLIVGTGNSTSGTVRLYDFYETINKGFLFSCNLGMSCEALGGAPNGSYPAGLPINCKVREAPPILFEVQCSDYILHFGCFPFHFVSSLPKYQEKFQVCDVMNQEMVENGIINITNTSTEECHISFHDDDSGRIIHYSNHAVRFFKLVDEEKGNKRLTECCLIDLKDAAKEETVSERRKRLSRNATKKKFSLSDKCFLSDVYENELDLYAVLGASSHFGDSIVKIHIFDNYTDKKIKCLTVDLDYDEFSDYELFLDLDTMMIIEKSIQGQYKCFMYQIQNTLDLMAVEEQKGRPSRSSKRKTSKHVKRKT